MALSQVTIVIYLVSHWGIFHRRQMIEALARNAKGWANLLCINPIVSVREAFGTAVWQELTHGKMEKIDFNLFLFTPCIPVPGVGRQQTQSRLGRWIITRQIRRALIQMGTSRKTVAWVFRPEQIAWLGLAQEDLVVYETYDEYRLDIFDDLPQEQMVQLDGEILDRADLVFAITEQLYETRRRLHPNVHYVPNGVDFELFSRTTDANCEEDKLLLNIPHPRMGYIGALSPKLDFDILHALAQSEVGSLVLVGYVLDRAQHLDDLLKRNANVYFLGRLNPRERLPRLLKGISVALIPFRNTHYNYVCNPHKLWEYMAAGRPIVSSRMAVTEALTEVVRIADSTNGFVSAVQHTIKNCHKARVVKGIEIARQHSWDKLTVRMLELMMDI